MKTNLIRISAFLFTSLTALGLGLSVHGCGGGSSGGGGALPVATESLTVESNSPPNSATGIPITARVVVTFDMDVNPATITTSSFVVGASGAQIAGTIVYNATTRTATWTPAAQLSAMVTHTVSLNSGIRSAVGNIGLTGATFSFTTGNMADVTAPVFNTPATAAAEDNAITIRVSWSTAGLTDDMDATSSLSFHIYRATTSGAHTFTTDLVGVAGPGSTSFDDEGLLPGTPYFYVVRAVDTSGNEETNTVEGTDTTPARQSYATDVAPLFVLGGGQTCSTAGCHDAATISGGLLMTPAATAYTEMAGIISNVDGGCSPLERVEPFDASDSLLYLKLTAPPCGSIMPSGALTLNATQLETIEDWIDEGALNN